ncbi:MAG: prepilin-type N-terminal cleavage/methylation domain-containing protein [Vicinamibacterales bacterium]
MPDIRSDRGFTLMELLVMTAIFAVLAGVGVGVTTTFVRMTRGESGAQQLDGFLKRHREMALARRRDIEIHFDAPNRVRSVQRPGLGDASATPVDLETLVLEGGVEYHNFAEVPDTPNAFGNGAPVVLGGNEPVMFASEGMFVDVNGDPINATVLLGIGDDALSATAVTILGTTASVERWRWNGAAWTK